MVGEKNNEVTYVTIDEIQARSRDEREKTLKKQSEKHEEQPRPKISGAEIAFLLGWPAVIAAPYAIAGVSKDEALEKVREKFMEGFYTRSGMDNAKAKILSKRADFAKDFIGSLVKGDFGGMWEASKDEIGDEVREEGWKRIAARLEKLAKMGEKGEQMAFNWGGKVAGFADKVTFGGASKALSAIDVINGKIVSVADKVYNTVATAGNKVAEKVTPKFFQKFTGTGAYADEAAGVVQFLEKYLGKASSGLINVFGKCAKGLPVLAPLVTGFDSYNEWSNAKTDKEKDHAIVKGVVATGVDVAIAGVAIANIWNPVGWAAGAYIGINLVTSYFTGNSVTQLIGEGVTNSAEMLGINTSTKGGKILAVAASPFLIPFSIATSAVDKISGLFGRKDEAKRDDGLFAAAKEKYREKTGAPSVANAPDLELPNPTSTGVGKKFTDFLNGFENKAKEAVYSVENAKYVSSDSIKEFQKLVGAKVDGKFGPETWKKAVENGLADQAAEILGVSKDLILTLNPDNNNHELFKQLNSRSGFSDAVSSKGNQLIAAASSKRNNVLGGVDIHFEDVSIQPETTKIAKADSFKPEKGISFIS
jgi:hypothetical protein